MPTLYYIIICLSLSSQSSLVHGFSPVSTARCVTSWNTRRTNTPSTTTRTRKVRILPPSPFAIAAGVNGGDFDGNDSSMIDGDDDGMTQLYSTTPPAPPTTTTNDEPLLSELKDQVIEAAANTSLGSMEGGVGGGDTSAPSSPVSVEGSSKAELKPGDEFLKEKRVPVTIRYSQVSGLRSFYLTAVKKITQSNPDVIIERKILPFVEGESEESSLFEILVDGRVVIGKSRSKWQSVSRNVNGPATSGMSVFISMQEIDAAIAKARRKRRPSTAYVPVADIAEEGGTPAIRLEMLKVGRNGKEEEHWEEQQS